MSLLSTPPRRSEDEYTGPAFGKAEHGHPSDLQFIWIAIALAVLTAIEVALYYVEKDGNISQGLNTTVLLLLAAIKFIVVAGFFMHLRYDHPQFRRYFVGGGILAGFCYCAVLTAFGFFRGGMAWYIFGAGILVLIVLVAKGGITSRGESEAHEGHDGHDHDHGDHAHAH
jgi:cytochrome c oxidase subunit IV